MTGAEIIGSLLLNHLPLLAVVPLAGIKADRLDEPTPIPALLVTDISFRQRRTLRRGEQVRVTERIRVTVRAKTADQRRQVMELVWSCCSDWTGNMDGVTGIAVLEDGRGPGLVGVGNSFEQAQDFLVSYSRPATLNGDD